jgi:hypothetical protein
LVGNELVAQILLTFNNVFVGHLTLLLRNKRKQRLYTTKEEASSPTVAIERILLSCVIDVEEGRHVAKVNILSDFMQVDMDEMVHI